METCKAPRTCNYLCVPGRDYCEHHALIHDGCDYTSPSGKSEKCARLREVGKPFCPKHNVMAEGYQGDLDRKMEKVRRAKDRKKDLRDALPDSPLRSYNPAFENRSGYGSD